MKVLVVDDDEMVLFVSSGMLTMMHHEVITAKSGVEAIRAVQASAVQINLLLIDDIMHEMSGAETLRQLYSLGIRIPFVVCSGRSISSEDFMISPDYQPMAILSKPFTFQQMQELLQRVPPGESPSN